MVFCGLMVDSTPSTGQAPSGSPRSGERLIAVDALRGFDMIWIIGAESMIPAMVAIDTSFSRFVARQLDHAAWTGFTFFDLIFPLFLFIVGIAIVFSLEKVKARGGLRAGWRRVLPRVILLFVLGILYGGQGLAVTEKIRLLNVLQRIALCYGAVALLYLAFRPRTLVAIGAATLLGYWALFAFVPIRDINLERTQIAARVAETGATPRELYDGTTTYVTGALEEGRNLAHHVDFLYLPLFKWDGHYDPEGLLSTLPAIVSCLLGVFAGLLLRRPGTEVDDRRKVKALVAAGLILVATGWVWGMWFPIIKKLWTPSYVLYGGGWCCLLLALFYEVIEVRKRQRWATPFIWIGLNPIAVYLAHRFADFPALSRRIAGGPIAGAFGIYGPLWLSAVEIAISLLFVRFLYQRKIFLRV
jgi:predicted acyltransferase